MKRVPLSKIAEINPRIPNDVTKDPTCSVSFIPMAGVSESGSVVDVDTRQFAEVQKGYRYFEEGDILLAKITPCMENGKAALTQYLPFKLGFGSTEFHVIRPGRGIDARYLFYMVWNPHFRFLASRNMTGSAGQKRVPARFLERYEIPVPTLETQRRIAAILNKADTIRHKRAEGMRMADEFLKAAFLDMFGNPVTNPKGWELDSFGSVGELDRGRSRHRPRNAPELLGGPYPLIQTGDIANSGGYIRGYTQTYSELGLAQSKTWPVGTLCITIAANIAKTAILTIEACFPDSVVGFKPYSKVRTEYIQYWLSFLQKILEENAPESAQKNINLEILRNLKVPIPPIKLQDRFIRIVQNTEQTKERVRDLKHRSCDLFNSLVQRAFRGEL